MGAPVVAQLRAATVCNEATSSHDDGVRAFPCSGGWQGSAEETEGLEETEAALQEDLLRQLAL